MIISYSYHTFKDMILIVLNRGKKLYLDTLLEKIIIFFVSKYKLLYQTIAIIWKVKSEQKHLKEILFEVF